VINGCKRLESPMSEGFDQFELLVSSSDRDVRLSVSGDIDLSSAPMLRDALQRVQETGTGDVAVDLSHTRFCDSAGLHALPTQQALNTAGRKMRRRELIPGESRAASCTR
jgi:anti-anti-sigma factor